MASRARFCVSLDEALMRRFDVLCREEGYPTRSEAVAGVLRERLARTALATNGTVAGALVLAYDHHRRDLLARLTRVQHDFGAVIVSTQHVHLDHDTCLETVIVRGAAADIRRLVNALRGLKGLGTQELVPALAVPTDTERPSCISPTASSPRR